VLFDVGIKQILQFHKYNFKQKSNLSHYKKVGKLISQDRKLENNAKFFYFCQNNSNKHYEKAAGLLLDNFFFKFNVRDKANLQHCTKG
jgi:hypothetical protein